MLSCPSTNITEEARKRNTSRGDLVSDFLLSPAKRTMEGYIKSLTRAPLTEEERLTHRDYAGFNLTLISMAEEDGAVDPTDGSSVRPPRMALVTNSGGGGTLTARWLSKEETKCGGMSNGVDGSTMDLWTKVKMGRNALDSVINTPHRTEEELCEDLFAILASVIPLYLQTRTDRSAERIQKKYPRAVKTFEAPCAWIHLR